MSIFNASRLLGKTVLITGASAGIGAVLLILSGVPLSLYLPDIPILPSGHRRIICKGTNATCVTHHNDNNSSDAISIFVVTNSCTPRRLDLGGLELDPRLAPSGPARESRRGCRRRAQGRWRAGRRENRHRTARRYRPDPSGCAVVQGTTGVPQRRHPRCARFFLSLLSAHLSFLTFLPTSTQSNSPFTHV